MKTIIKISDGKRTYSEDVTDESREISEISKMPFTTENIEKYKDHYIFGWCECFLQSDDVPSWMYENELTIEVQYER